MLKITINCHTKNNYNSEKALNVSFFNHIVKYFAMKPKLTIVIKLQGGIIVKITSFGMNSVNPYNKQQKNLKAAESKGAPSTDKIEISSAAKEMSTSSTYSAERAQKLQKLKEQIQSGEYQVDAQKVAENMLKYYRK